MAPSVRARQLRQEALGFCSAGERVRCLDGLDQAAALDPEGDRAPEIQDARRKAQPLLAPSAAPPAPVPSATVGATRFGKVNPGRLSSDTAPPGRCVCSKGDPLCSCF